ncbi:MAG TPA: periplasmic heavy metal sensor [Chromatiales bacterium]|nr:periplasmic heavy metal sensor [Chromatiales bacterium]
MNGKWAMSRMVVAALIASLVLNVGLAAMLTARWNGPSAPPSRHRPEAFMERLVARLPVGERATLRAAIRAYGPQITARYRALRAARDRVRHAFDAQPFDRAALETAFAETRTHMAALQAAVQAAIADAAGKLSPAARHDLAPPRR